MDSTARRQVVSWLRSPVASRIQRWVIALICVAVLGEMWAESSAERYSGLPINTLGQALGDLIMMGVALPLVLTRRPGQEHHEGGLGAAGLAARLDRTSRHIQLLDVASALFPAAQEDRDAILVALRAALSRDVTVEILLPEHTATAGLDGRRDPPGRTAEEDLLLLRDAVPAGKLDIHRYRQAPPLALARCDDRLWIAFTGADELNGASPISAEQSFLCLDAHTRNAHVVALYFARLADADRHARGKQHSSTTARRPKAEMTICRPDAGA